MKKRIITVMVAALALLTLTASTAAAVPPYDSGSGVLVRTDDGYRIIGTLRYADSVVGTVHGTLIERTTGFNTCPAEYFRCFFGEYLATCNLLEGEISVNFQGLIYEGTVGGEQTGRVGSSLCRNADNPTSYQLAIWLWSVSHVAPGEFPDVLGLGGTVQPISPTVFKWST